MEFVRKFVTVKFVNTLFVADTVPELKFVDSKLSIVEKGV
jgi:hypothetical protein